MVVVGVLPLSIRVAVIVGVSMCFVLRFCYVPKICVESFEALFPMAAVLIDPAGDLPERPRLQPAWSPLRPSSLLDEPSSLEHPQVLGNGGLAHVEGSGKILDRGFALSEPGQDRTPRRVGEGGECRAERVDRLHAHH